MPRGARAPQRRRALRGGTPHERLLAAATEIFTLRGYAATSVRTIVERAGLTKPALYYHFGSKEGIYRALAEQILREFEASLTTAASVPGDVRVRTISICSSIFSFARQHLESVRFFYGVFYGPVQSAPPFDFQLFMQRFRQTIRSVLAEGASRGEIRADAIDDLATAVEAVLNLGVEICLGEPQRNFSEHDLGRLITLLITGAATGPAPRPGSTRTRRKEIHA